MKKPIFIIMSVFCVFSIATFTHGGDGHKKAKPVNVLNEPLEVKVINRLNKPIPVECIDHPYRFVGRSESALPGNAGHRAMHEACQETFEDPTARMCTSKDIFETPDLPILDIEAVWVHPVIVGFAAPSTTIDFSGRIVRDFDGALSCNSWDRNSDDFAGLIWSRDSTFRFGRCNYSRYVSCCVPE